MSGMDVNVLGSVVLASAATPANVGALRIFSENDDGGVTGNPWLMSPRTTENSRLEIAHDSIWDYELFNYSAQNFNKHRLAATTLTAAWATGGVTLNAAGVTTAATGIQISSYQFFPLIAGSSVEMDTYVAFNVAIPTGVNVDIGAPMVAAAATSIPLDGVYFRVNSAGIVGVVNYNGSEAGVSGVFTIAPAGANFAITPGQVHKFTISITHRYVSFLIDGILYARINRGTSQAQPIFASALQWGVRQHHVAATGAVLQTKVFAYNTRVGDFDLNRLWSTASSAMGFSGVQYPGGTAGQTANGVNSTIPAAGALSNTAASYATLGGKFTFAAIAGAETDYALFAFLVPAAAPGSSSKKLIVRGVAIDTFVLGAAVATTPTVLEWTLAIGSTAVSLATVDAVAARLPKRIPIGIQSFIVGAAVGALGVRVDANFDAALTVDPGTYVHVILRIPAGTATATQTFRGQVGINAYWE